MLRDGAHLLLPPRPSWQLLLLIFTNCLLKFTEGSILDQANPPPPVDCYRLHIPLKNMREMGHFLRWQMFFISAANTKHHPQCFPPQLLSASRLDNTRWEMEIGWPTRLWGLQIEHMWPMFGYKLKCVKVAAQERWRFRTKTTAAVWGDITECPQLEIIMPSSNRTSFMMLI